MAKLADKEKKVVEPKSQKKISKSKSKETKSQVKPKIAVKKKSSSIKKEEIKKNKLVVDKNISKPKETKKIDSKKSIPQTNSDQEFLSNFNWHNYEEGIDLIDQKKLDEFEKLINKNFIDTSDEDVIEGIVIHMTDKEAIIDINAKSEGVISLNEFRYNPELKVGDSVEVLIDTSDTVSTFQETVLKWDIGSLVETIIDTLTFHRTFSLSLPSGSSSFFELYSREYSSGSLDPKIEVYYRQEAGSNPDSSIVDTLMRIIYASEDISVIETLETEDVQDGNIFLSRARGIRAILNIPFDSLSLPQYSVIRSANLSLFQPGDSLDNFSVRMDPLKFLPDSGSSIFSADPYENLGMYFSSATVVSNKLQISLKSYFQSLLMLNL